MAHGFPASMVTLLRCPLDGGELETTGASGDRLVDADLRCAGCGRVWPIRDGIAHLLPEPPDAEESAREMRIRDEKIDAIVQRGGVEWTSRFADALETTPTLEALGSGSGLLVAELGCGAGRYTDRLLSAGHRVIAIDFSRASLALLGSKTAASAPLGLVWADVTRLRLAPGRFDRVLSTLHSNLPTRDHRMAAVRLAAEALKDEGRFVFSMHYRSLRTWLFGAPAAGHYAESGIYRYHMDAREAVRETAPYFARIRCAPISVNLPGVPTVAAARIAQRIPVLRQFGRLLLASAEAPRRAPAPGHVSPWSTRVAGLLGGPRADA